MIRRQPGILAPHTRRTGFTLIELLVVCSLLAIIMGMGAAFLGSMNRVLAVEAEKARLDALVRQAHNTAASENARAWLILDPETNRVEVRAMVTVAQWHFEDKDLTGYNRAGDEQVKPGNARLSEPGQGKIGRCLVFSGDRNGASLGESHLFDLPAGVAVEAWVFPYDGSGATLFQKGNGLALKLENGYLEGSLRGLGTVNSRRRNLPVPENRWTHVALSFDGRTLEVRVNEALGDVFPAPEKDRRKKKEKPAREEELRYKPDEKKPMEIGRGFRGRMDEVRVAGVLYPGRYDLDAAVRIDEERTDALTVHFAPGGWLDERFHPGPVTIVLTSRTAANSSSSLGISRLGTIR